MKAENFTIQISKKLEEHLNTLNLKPNEMFKVPSDSQEELFEAIRHPQDLGGVNYSQLAGLHHEIGINAEIFQAIQDALATFVLKKDPEFSGNFYL